MASQARIVGDSSLRKKLDKLASPKKGYSINVGIVATARYPKATLEGRPDRTDPPLVAEVAFWNEFGVKDPKGWGGPIPERPFMRRSIEIYLNDQGIKNAIKKLFDPKEIAFDKKAAGLLGLAMADIMAEKGIHHPRHKKNSPTTIAIKTKGKGGSTTPLIDEGTLKGAINFEVISQ